MPSRANRGLVAGCLAGGFRLGALRLGAVKGAA